MLRRVLEKRGGRDLDVLARSAVWSTSLQHEGWEPKAVGTAHAFAGGLGKGDLALLPLTVVFLDGKGRRCVREYRTTAVVLDKQASGYVGLLQGLAPYASCPRLAL